MKRIRFCATSVLLATTLFCTLVRAGRAAPPLANLVHFERIDADPNSSYPLTEKNGPWLIMATTFEGPQATESADKLVFELRKRYKLHAYKHEMKFDYSSKLPGRSVLSTTGQLRMRYNQSAVDQIAVLIGDFDGVDDPRAKTVLEKVRVLNPESLGGDRQKSQMFAALREQLLPASNERKNMGPMRLAFITTNPLIPESYFQSRSVDKLVVEMNRGVQYSLLDCPGRFTVKVATFNGNGTIDMKEIQHFDEKKDAAANVSSRLVVAAERAHKVTIFLRAKGYEAYEFHDRRSSIVTVGSFASLGSTGLDGRIQYNPEVQRWIDCFKERPMQLEHGIVGPVGPLRIESLKIYLDPHPTPMAVPRYSIGGDYVHRTLTVQ